LNESHLLRESKTKIAQIKTVINEKNNEEIKS
jgi:ribosomal protein L29